MSCDFVAVTTVPSKSDENTVIPELLIPRNAHNQRKYWIAIKANLFRGRACSPWLSSPKATSIQWGIAPLVTTNTTKAFFPISFTNTEYIIVATGHIDDDSAAYIRGVLYNHKETNTCVLRTSEANGPAAEYVAWGR